MNGRAREAREAREEAAERELTAAGWRTADAGAGALALLERTLAGDGGNATGEARDGESGDRERRKGTMTGETVCGERPAATWRRRAGFSLGDAVARVLLAVAVAAGLGAGLVPDAWAETITLVHVNDTHSHLDAWGPKDRDLEGTVGGMAKAARIVTRLREHEPNMLLLHAGDVFHGDLIFNATFGVPEFQLMKQLGFDAMAVGNHEFDLGPDVLAYALGAAFGGETLPLLSANLDLTGYPVLGTWIVPSVVKEVGGVRIGIFGMTTPDNPQAIPAPVVIEGAGDPGTILGIAGTQAAALRGSGAEIVICLSHLGFAYDRAIAANVPGIDIVVGGHDHDVLERPVMVTNPEGKPVPILQAGNHYRYVGRLRFDVEAGAVRVKDYALLDVDRKVEPLESVQAVVDELKAGIVAQYGDVYHLELARATSDLEMTTDPKKPFRDSAMGNLIADAQRAATGTDIAFTANGLISEGIPRGPIVGADLFRPVSYGYDPPTGLGLKIATFDISGVGLLTALETTLSFLGVDEDFLVQVSGMSFAYDPEAPVGARVVLDSVRIGGHPFDPFATYSATVNEGIALLLPVMGVEVTNLQVRPELEYDVLKEFVVGLHKVSYRPEGRIVDVSRHGPKGEGCPGRR